MSNKLDEEESNEPAAWPPESAATFNLFVSSDEPYRTMREWDRNKENRYRETELQAIKRLQDIIKLTAKSTEVKGILIEIAIKTLVEYASQTGIPLELVMAIIRNIFPS